MRFSTIIGVFAVLLLGWFAWWWFAATAQKAALTGWLEERRADGWVAEAAEISVSGFPNRLDATVRELSLADPRSGWAWEAPRLAVNMLAYAPNKAIAVFPPTQTVAAPGGRAEARAENMRASVAFNPEPGLSLNRAVIEIEGLTLDGADLGGGTWTAGLAGALAAVRESERAEGMANAYDVSVSGESLRLPAELKARVDPAGVLPDSIAAAEIDLTAALDAPLDRRAVEGRKPALRSVSLRRASFDWGELNLAAQGRVDIGPDGAPEGDIEIRARNWRQMLRASVEAGLMDEGLAGTIESALELTSALAGGGDSITLTLRMKAGLMFLGPVPLGAAPRLRPPVSET